ncbi:serine/threonine protein kinase [Capronia epimyces CBS 606.96]|uniref:Serine/threonine protein kinase n=1 Tax=Capronia epimyces CBS 606.96 TaxID=1182542 RepID=W9Y6H9_9EURO|nr:serine/threonine protein kinase [Capronia epimyces CBS 606.96]EXJ85240.1 serine/threonine protein kinase [Capronia epimyces CBS 606.96]
MAVSVRRSSTIRRTDRSTSHQEAPAASSHELEHGLRDASPDHLFSLFVSLVAQVHLGISDVEQGFIAGFMHKEVAVADFGARFVGRGRSFSVRCLKFSPPDKSLALKSVLPFGDFSSWEERERLGDLILELRCLSHPWLRGHPNIIQLLGLGWETDPAHLARKWPVLILEYADGGTLQDFLGRHQDLTFRERVKLCLDIATGLYALHRCAVVHGDLKPANVLVCLEVDHGDRKEWTATLADFGGSVLDVGEHERGRLAMGSFPWQAPEWKDWLNRQQLLATDLYSLGLLIWSVMAGGLEPVVQDVELFGLEEHRDDFNVFQQQVSELKRHRPAHFVECLMQAAKTHFAPQVDHRLIAQLLAVTVVTDPALRSIETLRGLLEHALDQDEVPTLVDQSLRIPGKKDEGDEFSFAPITTISHLENILMGPDMLDTLGPTILEYVRERLRDTFWRSEESGQRASAAFSLAIDALRSRSGPEAEAACLEWLQRAAQAGNQSAQSLLVRFHRTFQREIPSAVQAEIEGWIVGAAERNYPAAHEDLHLVLTPEESQSVWRRVRSRFANIGWNRFAPLYENMSVSLEQLDRDTLISMTERMQRPGFVPTQFDVNEHGDSLLHFGASAGLKHVVAAFAGPNLVVSPWKLAMPLDINSLGRWDESALLHACRSGHFAIAMNLLDCGANPTLASTAGDTPLHWVLSFEGSEAEQLAQRLVVAGAAVNAVAKEHKYQWAPLCDYERGTPLHRAVGRGRVDAVEALLKVGAAADDEGDRPDQKCPIYLAAQFYYPEILDLLLRSLDIHAPAARRYRGLSLLVAAIHGTDLYGLRFSMVARHGEKWLSNLHRTVDVLLEHGASEHLHHFPAGLDCAGTTPLQVAVGMGSSEILSYLLVHKGCASEVNIRTFVWYYGTQMVPLATAIYRAQKEAFDMLLASGADPFQPHFDDDGKQLSYLWQCAFAGHRDGSFARTLLARGVPVDQRPPGYETAFAAAVRNRCFQLAKFLLENGADAHLEFQEGLYLQSSDAATVLDYLIREQTRSALGAIEWLLHEVPDMNFIVSSSKQRSVLHSCAVAKMWRTNEAGEGGCKLIADTLMAHFKPVQEQLDMKDADGQTALYCATVMNNHVMVRVLVDAGAHPGVENDAGLSAVDVNSMILQMLEEGDPRLTDEIDPRPITAQIRSRVQKQTLIRQSLLPDT